MKFISVEALIQCDCYHEDANGDIYGQFWASWADPPFEVQCENCGRYIKLGLECLGDSPPRGVCPVHHSTSCGCAYHSYRL